MKDSAAATLQCTYIHTVLMTVIWPHMWPTCEGGEGSTSGMLSAAQQLPSLPAQAGGYGLHPHGSSVLLLSQCCSGILQGMPRFLEEQRGPSTDAEFEALPRPQPVPFEGDVIGYRLLHISADWTPQVCKSS